MAGEAGPSRRVPSFWAVAAAFLLLLTGCIGAFGPWGAMICMGSTALLARAVSYVEAVIEENRGP